MKVLNYALLWPHTQSHLTNTDKEMRHKLLSISLLFLWDPLGVFGQDGIECYECEATYGSFKYDAFYFMQRDFSKQLFERFRRGHCLNKFDDVEKVECLEVRLSQESIH